VPAGLGKVGVQFEEVGTRINLLPLLLPDGRVFLEVDCDVSEPTRWEEALGCTIMRRESHVCRTAATLTPGHTIVLGGITLTRATKESHAVPGLSDLPLVGDAFRRETTTHEDYEVMVLVTPHVVK